MLWTLWKFVKMAFVQLNNMQTFLPYSDFEKSLVSLDSKRLGKQRVEAFQILNTITGKSNGWKNHPTVKMWRGHENALKLYYNTALSLWQSRGYKNIKLQPIQIVGEVKLPEWLNNEAFHHSHQCNLVRKNPSHYIPIFGELDATVPYYWPL